MIFNKKLYIWAKLAVGIHGYYIEIVKSSIESLSNLSGVVVDETAHMIKVLSQDKIRTIPKKGSVFKITIEPGLTVRVNGENLLGKPEDRMKKKKYSW
ncbi:MAG: ribonuclease P protein subunit [Candidatus Heimdallarchaeum endolithica]|uniref:Ribonuclease P protein component 1 n=1 Tax=Candidatus Heimdallarchaeum endolithica TaxID=2876572 RepID=A0A9Y1FN96_9ARCH|nr:MAG: ribonuclease P protein subunit [Candidatus Heimdallarchaeum endolithica]